MRTKLLSVIPALAIIAAVPASAQVRVHVNIPIGHTRALYGPHRQLFIREYDPALFGPWESYYDDWAPVTVYLYDGQYYDYPIVSYAEPVIVYRYHDQVFFPPRTASFRVWRDARFPARGYGHGYGYGRPAPRVFERSRPEARVAPRSSSVREFRGAAPSGGRPEFRGQSRPESRGQAGGVGRGSNHGNSRGNGHGH